MITVLMINTKSAKCGVYSFGKRIYDIIHKSSKINVVYKEIDNEKDYARLMNEIKPKHVIYNWHHYTMQWLSEKTVASYKMSKHYFIFHTDPVRKFYTKYLFFGGYALDNSLVPTDRSILLPRPLFEYNGEYATNNVFTIGSFGFAFRQKGLPMLIDLVNKSFDEAIINLHMPPSGVVDPTGVLMRETFAECMTVITKPGISINISTNYLTDDEVLQFLAKNDINIFSYTPDYSTTGEGLSSAADYALSVKRPIAITDCVLFRHFRSDKIVLEKNTIKEIHDYGTEPVKKFYTEWSQANLIEQIEQLFINE